MPVSDGQKATNIANKAATASTSFCLGDPQVKDNKENYCKNRKGIVAHTELLVAQLAGVDIDVAVHDDMAVDQVESSVQLRASITARPPGRLWSK